MKTHFIVVYVTTPSRKEARSLAQLLLNKKLIACANILENLESHYWWRNKIEQSKEFALIMKTKKSLWKKLESTVKTHHSYDCPCIVAWPLSQITPQYEKWLLESLKPSTN